MVEKRVCKKEVDGYLTDKSVTKELLRKHFFFDACESKIHPNAWQAQCCINPDPCRAVLPSHLCVRLPSVWRACFSELVPAALLRRFCRFFGGFARAAGLFIKTHNLTGLTAPCSNTPLPTPPLGYAASPTV